MKKSVLLMIITLVSAISILLVPQIMKSAFPAVQAIRILNGDMKSTVTCKGTIYSLNTKTVSYGYALKITAVYVSIGDQVKKGQKLLSVDRQATLQALNSSGGSSSSSSSSQSSDYLNSLAKQYSLSEYAAASAAAASSSAAGNSGSAVSANVPDAICAPISGTVTQLGADSGAFTDSKSPIVVLSDLSRLEVIAQVEGSLVSKVKTGQIAYISGDGLSNHYKGIVTKIYPTADQSGSDGNTSSVNVAIKIEYPDSQLKPYLSADVEILTSDSPQTIAVPYEAVLEDDENTEYVFVLKNGRAVRRNIRTGNEYDSCIQVTKGLKEGDTVLINPPSTLKSGELVRIKSSSDKTGD